MKISILKKLSHSQILAGGFFIIILIGAVILNMGFSSAKGQSIGFLDALFTSTSSVCVTGLIVADTGTYWSDFGKFVIMILIQIGGLGFMTIATLGVIISGEKLSYSKKLLIQDSLSSEKTSDIIKFCKKIILVSLFIELVGAICLSIAFVPEFGFVKGICYGIFHSVTAFCNAGFDIMGNFSSLTAYFNNPIVNISIMLLIILGGLGFSTIFDINRKRAFKKFRLNTKIILITTAILIVIPTFLFFIFEMNNPKTLGSMNFGEKILASLFQVVSPRTAGYNTIELSQMYDSTKFLTIILMFIGGAPASTAGGLKTTTFALIIISVYCLFKQKSEIEIFGRTVPFKNLNKALVSLVIGFTLVITGTMIILSYSDFDFLTVLYEVTSAYATVGLTLGITTKLNAICKITLIILMFMGRVGSLTVLYSFIKTDSKKKYKYPKEEINIG
ncbi:trk system potassium uptake protein TrkH [[Eubacterium] yurii]|jgi:potassium uptake protein, trkH family|nr:trk system potassium uptake protein TrkH [[Eubacterium] yurii]